MGFLSDRESTSFSHLLTLLFVNSFTQNAPHEYSALHASGFMLGAGYTEMNKTACSRFSGGAHSLVGQTNINGYIVQCDKNLPEANEYRALDTGRKAPMRSGISYPRYKYHSVLCYT